MVAPGRISSQKSRLCEALLAGLKNKPATNDHKVDDYPERHIQQQEKLKIGFQHFSSPATCLCLVKRMSRLDDKGFKSMERDR